MWPKAWQKQLKEERVLVHTSWQRSTGRQMATLYPQLGIRGECWCSAWLFLIQSGTPFMEWCWTHLGWIVPPKLSQSRNCLADLEILDPVRLTVSINYHRCLCPLPKLVITPSLDERCRILGQGECPGFPDPSNPHRAIEEEVKGFGDSSQGMQVALEDGTWRKWVLPKPLGERGSCWLTVDPSLLDGSGICVALGPWACGYYEVLWVGDSLAGESFVKVERWGVTGKEPNDLKLSLVPR